MKKCGFVVLLSTVLFVGCSTGNPRGVAYPTVVMPAITVPSPVLTLPPPPEDVASLPDGTDPCSNLLAGESCLVVRFTGLIGFVPDDDLASFVLVADGMHKSVALVHEDFISPNSPQQGTPVANDGKFRGFELKGFDVDVITDQQAPALFYLQSDVESCPNESNWYSLDWFIRMDKIDVGYPRLCNDCLSSAAASVSSVVRTESGTLFANGFNRDHNNLIREWRVQRRNKDESTDTVGQALAEVVELRQKLSAGQTAKLELTLPGQGQVDPIILQPMDEKRYILVEVKNLPEDDICRAIETGDQNPDNTILHFNHLYGIREASTHKPPLNVHEETCSANPGQLVAPGASPCGDTSTQSFSFQGHLRGHFTWTTPTSFQGDMQLMGDWMPVSLGNPQCPGATFEPPHP